MHHLSVLSCLLSNRGLEHSADVQEIDDLESYLNARLP